MLTCQEGSQVQGKVNEALHFEEHCLERFLLSISFIRKVSIALELLMVLLEVASLFACKRKLEMVHFLGSVPRDGWIPQYLALLRTHWVDSPVLEPSRAHWVDSPVLEPSRTHWVDSPVLEPSRAHWVDSPVLEPSRAHWVNSPVLAPSRTQILQYGLPPGPTG